MLAELTSGALADAARRAESVSLDEIETRARQSSAPRDVYEALAPTDNVKIIAEVKRASPSKGPLADISDPAALARNYELGGASAISVLTEERRFLGSLDDLLAVRQAVNVPVLRKDFISSAYQVFEARAAGADFILLIVAALEPRTLDQLHNLASDLGLGVLVETHSGDEVKQAVDVGARMIGVNARDLRTFDLDRDLFSRVAEFIPTGTIRVAESAVRTVSDVEHYRRAGADVVLVGEALVTSDPLITLESFMKVV